jgi:sodium/pantothenate symporter
VVIDIAWAFVYAVGPWQASRHLMARNEHVVLRAAILACFFVIVLQMLVYGIGGLMNLANTNITPTETVMIWGAQNLVPETEPGARNPGRFVTGRYRGCRPVVSVDLSFAGWL